MATETVSSDHSTASEQAEKEVEIIDDTKSESPKAEEPAPTKVEQVEKVDEEKKPTAEEPAITIIEEIKKSDEAEKPEADVPPPPTVEEVKKADEEVKQLPSIRVTLTESEDKEVEPPVTEQVKKQDEKPSVDVTSRDVPELTNESATEPEAQSIPEQVADVTTEVQAQTEKEKPEEQPTTDVEDNKDQVEEIQSKEPRKAVVEEVQVPEAELKKEEISEPAEHPEKVEQEAAESNTEKHEEAPVDKTEEAPKEEPLVTESFDHVTPTSLETQVENVEQILEPTPITEDKPVDHHEATKKIELESITSKEEEVPVDKTEETPKVEPLVAENVDQVTPISSEAQVQNIDVEEISEPAPAAEDKPDELPETIEKIKHEAAESVIAKEEEVPVDKTEETPKVEPLIVDSSDQVTPTTLETHVQKTDVEEISQPAPTAEHKPAEKPEHEAVESITAKHEEFPLDKTKEAPKQEPLVAESLDQVTPIALETQAQKRDVEEISEPASIAEDKAVEHPEPTEKIEQEAYESATAKEEDAPVDKVEEATKGDPVIVESSDQVTPTTFETHVQKTDVEAISEPAPIAEDKPVEQPEPTEKIEHEAVDSVTAEEAPVYMVQEASKEEPPVAESLNQVTPTTLETHIPKTDVEEISHLTPAAEDKPDEQPETTEKIEHEAAESVTATEEEAPVDKVVETPEPPVVDSPNQVTRTTLETQFQKTDEEGCPVAEANVAEEPAKEEVKKVEEREIKDVKTDLDEKGERTVVNEELAAPEEKGVETSEVTEKAREVEIPTRDIESVAENGNKKDKTIATTEANEATEVEKKVDEATAIATEPSVEVAQKTETQAKDEKTAEAEKVVDETAKIEAPTDGEDKKTTEEVPVKTKQSNNLLSKVKHSLAKAKKALIGKSPNTKSETKSEVKDK